MSYIHTKKIKGHDYLYESESYRENGIKKTRHVRYIGKVNTTNTANVNTNSKAKQNNSSNVLNKSIKYYGYTDNPNEAGYILPNGKMLDFSGRSEAQGYKNRIPQGQDYLANSRSVDHRDVKRFYPNKNVEYQYEYVVEFMKDTGAIRFSDSGDIYLNKTKPLTNEQIRTINRVYKESRHEHIIIENDLLTDNKNVEYNTLSEFNRGERQ